MGEVTMSKGSFWALMFAFLGTTLLVGLLCGLLPNRDADCTIKVTEEPEEPRSTSSGPTTPPQLWEKIRLPTNLKPHHYDLFFRIDITNEEFSGTNTMLIECLQSIDIILIHSKLLVIDDNSITLAQNGGGGAPGVTRSWLYPENQYLVIELDGMLEAGTSYDLTIAFSGPLQEDLIGLYKSSYVNKDGDTKWLASTFFAPTDARKAFPCFDEPAHKAEFTVTIENEPGYFALANMPLDGDNETIADGWVRSRFQKSVPMSTYLLCFVVCDFISEEKETQGGVQFRVWARPEARNSVRYALEKGADIIDFFEDYFQIPFPLPKMDMIAIPDFTAGAMENWGLITYRETALLYTEGVSSPRNKQRVCTVVSHELAHQWFGNLVTLQWWDDTWLNEGFASYVEYLGVEEVEPDWGMGASILRMLQNFLGEATFKKGLNSYLTAFAYSNAVNGDLWFHLTQAADEDGKDIDVTAIMETWTLQMGFPVIDVTRSYGGNVEYSASQHRFLSNPDSEEQNTYPDLGYKWYVPLTHTSSANPNFQGDQIEWLNPDDEGYNKDIGEGSDSDWLLVNIREYGYHRVNYDANNWQLIAQQLEDDNTVRKRRVDCELNL
ncbi:putative aminopeptidase N [Apostichopus japonicus]|uniref:Putative aminopeptidase N n=1 Tax=Stichopus japonicus TaxID=307972 RepID=A0A2G8JJH7_STIJA|nr:putative aminopeptidase N [Apostichopus japonicus]